MCFLVWDFAVGGGALFIGWALIRVDSINCCFEDLELIGVHVPIFAPASRQGLHCLTLETGLLSICVYTLMYLSLIITIIVSPLSFSPSLCPSLPSLPPLSHSFSLIVQDTVPGIIPVPATDQERVSERQYMSIV